MPHDRELVWNYWLGGFPSYETPVDDPIWWEDRSGILYECSYFFATVEEGQDHWDAMATALMCVTGVGEE